MNFISFHSLRNTKYKTPRKTITFVYSETGRKKLEYDPNLFSIVYMPGNNQRKLEYNQRR